MINRFIIKDLRDDIKRPEINILLGPRQVGKTTTLRCLEQELREKGERTCFYDLEQPQMLAEFNRPITEIIEKIKSAGDFVFIDEFQYLENASKILKAVYDSRRQIKLFCSGSSSLAIHKHLKESLAGRRFICRIYPLTFCEMKAGLTDFSIETYLRYGGMPALVQAESEATKQRILSELLSAFILKDIKSLVKEENIRAFNHLLYLLAENQGSVISVHSLAGEVGMSFKAVQRYLDVLEETFVNFRLYSYSTNLGNELKKSCKTYLYDLGIRNALLRDFSATTGRTDEGAIVESFVFLKLQPFLKPNMELKFWRTRDGDEVDFVLLTDRKPIPIEVKAHAVSGEMPKGLKRFLLRYPKTTSAYVIGADVSAESEVGHCRIKWVTLDQFAQTPGLIISKSLECEDVSGE